jgi:hypothetical protein
VSDDGLRVVLEVTPKKSFATAIDWPGWSRPGKTPELALEALAAYEQRYREAIRSAPVRLPAEASARIEVVERLEGNATTAFGAPGVLAEADRTATDAATARRLAHFLETAWATFDRTAKAAPSTLRKGPRGGGRDTAKIVDHVNSADHGYAGAVGIKVPPPRSDDPASVKALRAAMLDVVRSPSDGSPVHRTWTVRFLVRRSAWHALDHAWEIEDRGER